MKIHWKKLLYSLGAVFATMLFCKIFTGVGVDSWYKTIEKPAITPPNYVFPIAWSILYVMIAIAFYLVFARTREFRRINALFLSQLVLQILWCASFFYSGQFVVGLIILFILDYLALKTIKHFWSHKYKVAAIMLVPYFLWILFATALNWGFVAQMDKMV